MKQFFSTPELAERYDVPEATIRKWRHTGTGPRGVRLGRHVRYPADEVEKWEAERLEAEPREAA